MCKASGLVLSRGFFDLTFVVDPTYDINPRGSTTIYFLVEKYAKSAIIKGLVTSYPSFCLFYIVEFVLLFSYYNLNIVAKFLGSDRTYEGLKR